MIARPILADSTNNGRAQPGDVIFQNLESIMVAVTSDDYTSVLHELRQISCFAAWCSTRVENFFSWLWIEKLTRDRCAGVLDVALTRIESGHGQSIEFYKIWVAG